MAPGAGHGTTRRWIAGCAVALGLLALPAAAAASAGTDSPQAHAATKTATSILHTAVPAKGNYLLIVWVRSRTKHSRLVDIYIKGHPMKTVVANPWWGAAVYYTLDLSPTNLAVRTVNAPPAVAVRATLSLRKAASPSSQPKAPTNDSSSTSTTAPSSSSSSSTPTTTTTTPAPTPPTITPPASSEFGTTPVFSDNFQSDFQSGATEPATNTWGFDNWGSCGTGTLSTSNTNDAGSANYDLDGVNPDSNIYLTGNGLSIRAVPDPEGGSSYVSGQLDSAAAYNQQGFSSQYGEVEASIEMPQSPSGAPAQGVCPGFWLLGDNDIGGNGSGNPPGEIDIIEAPAFAGTQGFPAFFDLHGNSIGGSTQHFTANTSAVGNLSAGFHTYALAWTPTTMTWLVDGTPYAEADQTKLVAGASWANDFDTSTFHMLFTLSVGGWPCDAGLCTPQTSPQDYTMTVQWVKWFPLAASS